jgi:hypothetical protein
MLTGKIRTVARPTWLIACGSMVLLFFLFLVVALVERNNQKQLVNIEALCRLS